MPMHGCGGGSSGGRGQAAPDIRAHFAHPPLKVNHAAGVPVLVAAGIGGYLLLKPSRPSPSGVGQPVCSRSAGGRRHLQPGPTARKFKAYRAELPIRRVDLISRYAAGWIAFHLCAAARRLDGSAGRLSV